MARTRQERMIETLRSRIQGHASTMLAGRLEAHITTAGDDDQALRLAIDKIRVSLRLFVDEDLAERVAAELTRLARI